uniref:Regulator of G protein signaling 2 n=1 Tax=Xiphophorus couchianus TaxID=32473 RepID=A0A3B5LA35_9TELE
MRKNLSSMSSQNMALPDCMKPSDLSAEKRGIKALFSTFRPSVDDVNQWAQSLDKLLGHKYGKAAFHIFLKSEFCEENVEFWTACENFKSLTSQKALTSKANRIYEEFIKSEAPKEINLDFNTRNAIEQCLHAPTATSFHAAQKKVYSLMENNSYPRFIHSDLYKELCAVASGNSKLIKC